MSSSSGNNICDNCSDQDGRVYIHTMCQTCREKHEEKLFQQPPPNEDCPICFLPLPSLRTGRKYKSICFLNMPFLSTGRKYKSCCGKIICRGCIRAVKKMEGDAKCPFCRIPAPETDEEVRERIMKRVEMDDAEAIFNIGWYYAEGTRGLPQDRVKALELWHRAGELDSASAYYNIGWAYYYGEGVGRDNEKAKHYWELAAIGGNVSARYNLGGLEVRAGNMSRALKHHMIAARCGHNDSLKKIREFYTNGRATKDDGIQRFIELAEKVEAKNDEHQVLMLREEKIVQLQGKDKVIAVKDAKIAAKDVNIKAKEDEIDRLKEQLASKDEEIAVLKVAEPAKKRPRTEPDKTKPKVMSVQLQYEHTNCSSCYEKFSCDMNNKDDRIRMFLPVLSSSISCDHYFCHGCILRRQATIKDKPPKWIPCMSCKTKTAFCPSKPKYHRMLIQLIEQAKWNDPVPVGPVKEEQSD